MGRECLRRYSHFRAQRLSVVFHVQYPTLSQKTVHTTGNKIKMIENQKKHQKIKLMEISDMDIFNNHGEHMQWNKRKMQRMCGEN